MLRNFDKGVNRKNVPNGMYELYSFDALSRPTLVRTFDSSSALRDEKSYTWDAASRVTSATEGGVTATYGYDLIDQLTSETKAALSYSATYTYDANGNRATRTVNGVTENYTYDGADKLTAITGGPRPRTFGYDTAGRTTSITESAGTTTLSYDYSGNLTLITYADLSHDNFAYNGADARVSSSGVNGYKTFRRNGTSITSPVMGDGASNYTPGVSVKTGTTTKYYHVGLKNTTEQSDSSQTVSASRHFDAFGCPIASYGSWAGIFGYAGKYGYQEDGSGLKLLGHRFYDSDTSRFVLQDPIGSGRNWYSYVSNSPIARADPAGLEDILIAVANNESSVTGTHAMIGLLDNVGKIKWYGLRQNGLDRNDLPILGQEYAFIQKHITNAQYKELERIIGERSKMNGGKGPTWLLNDNNCAHFIAKVLREAGQFESPNIGKSGYKPKDLLRDLEDDGTEEWIRTTPKVKRRPQPAGGGGGSSGSTGSPSSAWAQPESLRETSRTTQSSHIYLEALVRWVKGG